MVFKDSLDLCVWECNWYDTIFIVLFEGSSLRDTVYIIKVSFYHN